ncbi:hypothetical protein [Methylomagnum ishizawai]|uniref:hypothetical protein n=1 Tax=Methylomagnum ishizawai TaxID=1760988 RepID=UPI001C7F96CE|nr:hypothetical protein [Methylomagnum ishizawai]
MLHKIPDSSQRRRLLRVVVLQRRLVRALCGLEAGSSVNQAWLESLRGWKRLDPDWVRRFWENDNGNRALWINRIASASIKDKQAILAIGTEQLRFRELWQNPPSIRMRKLNWKAEPFQSLDIIKNH